MASTAISAQLTTLKCPLVSGTAADTLIENIVSFTGFDGEAGEIDRTNLSSLAKEKLTGLADNGTFSGEWHPEYGATGQDRMRVYEGSGVAENFELTLSDGTKLQFAGAVKNAGSISGGVDAILGGSFSIAVDGVVTVV